MHALTNAQGAHNTSGHTTVVSRGYTSLSLPRSPTALGRRGRPRAPMPPQARPGLDAHAPRDARARGPAREHAVCLETVRSSAPPRHAAVGESDAA